MSRSTGDFGETLAALLGWAVPSAGIAFEE